MVVVGTDAHKYSHTFVATDEVGRQLGEKTVKATTAGHATAIMWAREQFGLELIWGIEDCRNMSARLERDLLAAGQQVVRVPTKLMAQTRKSARSRGKSDPIDALAVARAVLRETDLPLATHDETSRELKLLTDRRDVLVAQRTSAINRLRWLVHELDPERAPAARSLDAASTSRPCGPGWTPARIGRRTRARRADRHHPAHRRDQHPGPAHQRPSPPSRPRTAGNPWLARS
ncbi:Mobile element protein [Mycobacterium tuberculosis variant bovis BCG]|nr:Mobile element protein [Mycobacterium tuberculosis variant bovis BCG]